MKWIKYAITGLLVIGLVYFLIKIDAKLVWGIISSANVWLLVLGIAAILASIFCKILRFKLVVRYFGHRLSLAKASYIQMSGIALAILTPARVGELSKVYFMKEEKINPGISFVIVIFERLFDLILLASIGTAALALVFRMNQLAMYLGIFILVFVLMLVFLRNIRLLNRMIPKRYQEFLQEFYKLKTQNRYLLLIALFTALAWIFEGLLLWLLGISVGVDVHPLTVLGIVGLSTIAALFSFLPAGLVTMDFSLLYLYGKLGVAREAATSVIILYRILGTILPFIIALLMQNLGKIKNKK